jgi:hypothetical protein
VAFNLNGKAVAVLDQLDFAFSLWWLASLLLRLAYHLHIQGRISRVLNYYINVLSGRNSKC